MTPIKHFIALEHFNSWTILENNTYVYLFVLVVIVFFFIGNPDPGWRGLPPGLSQQYSLYQQICIFLQMQLFCKRCGCGQSSLGNWLIDGDIFKEFLSDRYELDWSERLLIGANKYKDFYIVI